MRLAHLGGAKLERDGFDARLKAKRLPLTRAAAAALNRVLGLPKVLRAGRSLGSANGLGEPSAVQIAFGQIAIGGPDTTFSKLESLEVEDGDLGRHAKVERGRRNSISCSRSSRPRSPPTRQPASSKAQIRMA